MSKATKWDGRGDCGPAAVRSSSRSLCGGFRATRTLHLPRSRRKCCIAEESDRRDHDRPMMLALTWEQASALHDIALALGGTELHHAMVRTCDMIEARGVIGMQPVDVSTILHDPGVTDALARIDGGDGLLSAVLAAFGKGGRHDA